MDKKLTLTEKRAQDLKDFFDGKYDKCFKKIGPNSVEEIKQRVLNTDLTVPLSPEKEFPDEKDDLKIDLLMRAYRVTLLYIESMHYYEEHGSASQRKVFEEAMLHKIKHLPTRNL